MCHPDFPPPPGPPLPVPPPPDVGGGVVTDTLGEAEIVGVGVGVTDGVGLLVGDLLGVGGVVDGTAEGDVLGDDGALVVGAAEDRFWLGFGLADADRLALDDGDSRLVPGKPAPVELEG